MFVKLKVSNSVKYFLIAAICNLELIVVIFGKYNKTIFRQQIQFSDESKFLCQKLISKQLYTYFNKKKFTEKYL